MFLQPINKSNVSMVTITNGPKPMPAIAALLAKPGDFGQNRLTITLIVGIDAAACPIAKTTPYKITNCQKSCTNQINPVPNATIVIAIESITRISNLSAILPSSLHLKNTEQTLLHQLPY